MRTYAWHELTAIEVAPFGKPVTMWWPTAQLDAAGREATLAKSAAPEAQPARGVSS